MACSILHIIGGTVRDIHTIRGVHTIRYLKLCTQLLKRPRQKSKEDHHTQSLSAATCVSNIRIIRGGGDGRHLKACW